MTIPQIRKYWREWSFVRREDAFADRHKLHIKALGKDKSHKEFTNKEFDAVLAVFRAVYRPDDLNDQINLADMERTRTLYAIRRCGFPEEYMSKIVRERFGAYDWQALHLDELKQFAMTLSNRARARDREITTCHNQSKKVPPENCPF